MKSKSPKTKLQKRSRKNKSKKISKNTKELANIQKLYDELNELNTKLETLILDSNSTDKEQNKIMNKMEELQFKINKKQSFFYPSIYNNKFAEQLYQQNDFNLYKIKNKELDIKHLLEEYKNQSASKNTSKKSNKEKSIKKTQKKLKKTLN